MMRRVLLLSFFMCGCFDDSARKFTTLQIRYSDLVKAGAAPHSKEFDQLLVDLNAISPASKAFANARELKVAIESSRRLAIEQPLAVSVEANSNGSALQETREECQRLARELSALEGEARAQQIARIDACRRKIALLRKEVEMPSASQK